MREVKGTMNLNIQKTTFSSVLYYTLIILLLFVPYFTTMINNKLFYLTFESIFAFECKVDCLNWQILIRQFKPYKMDK